MPIRSTRPRTMRPRPIPPVFRGAQREPGGERRGGGFRSGACRAGWRRQQCPAFPADHPRRYGRAESVLPQRQPLGDLPSDKGVSPCRRTATGSSGQARGREENVNLLPESGDVSAHLRQSFQQLTPIHILSHPRLPASCLQSSRSVADM